MNEINIANQIIALRKAKGITQEQLAQAINVSAQAVSKWETETCLPDVQTLPLIAEYFEVSIDYLYHGKNMAYNDIYEKNYQKVVSYPQMCEESYREAFQLFACAHFGVSGNLCTRNHASIVTTPFGITHISSPGGVSLADGNGFGAVVTRKYFETVSDKTIDFCTPILKVLGDEICFRIVLAVLSMSDISHFELLEKTAIEETELKRGLDVLIEKKIIFAEVSKHKALGTTYKINELYHSGICILLACLETTRAGLDGISCCMGYGDYPIDI